MLAKNQGLYNGFLAAGIIAALAAGHGPEGVHARLFFGVCVVVAGMYGAVSTGKRSILVMQTVPALLAIGTLLLSS